MNFVLSYMRDLFKSINGFLQFGCHNLWIILYKIFWLHRINYFINVSIQKHNLYIHPCKTMVKIIQSVIIVLRESFYEIKKKSLFVINVFFLLKLLVTTQSLYISILPIEFVSTIDIYLQLMSFTLSGNLLISQMSYSTISFITSFMSSIHLRVRAQHDLTKVDQTFSVNLTSYSCF